MNLKDAGIYDLINIFKGQATTHNALGPGASADSKERFINIPAYQRPYRWDENNITELFEDYLENEEEYFLGSAVAVEKEGPGPEFDIVDGQQRITTLYLLNYIRFLLKKEYALRKLDSFDSEPKSLCNELKDIYVNLVGKNEAPFNNIIDEIEKDTPKQPGESDYERARKRKERILSCYKKQLLIAEKKDTEEETIKEIKKLSKKFLDSDKLCLKYTRPKYNEILKEALYSVYLVEESGSNNYKLDECRSEKEDSFLDYYLIALHTIFKKVWESSEGGSSLEKLDSSIELINKMIQNLTICVVVTEKEDDANKLFEVLNNRSLEVQDLELIKNHFYKEYCTKSSDTDDEKDKSITELDEIWTDKIFNINRVNKSRDISYYSTVYITRDGDLDNKNSIKFIGTIKKKYSENYDKNTKQYTKDEIAKDFNIHFSVKMILDTFGYNTKKLQEESFQAEISNYSIVYKCFHLLRAQNQPGVLAALINVILSTYEQNYTNGFINDDFETTFKNFVESLKNNKNPLKNEEENIYKCAHILWSASIRGKDYKTPRNIAKAIIEKYGRGKYDSGSIELSVSNNDKLNEEFESWIDKWQYESSKKWIIKILIYHLLETNRKPKEGVVARRNPSITLTTASLTYNMDAGKIDLDHLEPENIKPKYKEQYYKWDKPEERRKEVNGYLGNFMILDDSGNSNKSNYPLATSLDSYAKLEESWLIIDIKEMMKDSTYFNSKKIPKIDFFKKRSEHLKEYFKAYLNKRFGEDEIKLHL